MTNQCYYVQLHIACPFITKNILIHKRKKMSAIKCNSQLQNSRKIFGDLDLLKSLSDNYTYYTINKHRIIL